MKNKKNGKVCAIKIMPLECDKQNDKIDEIYNVATTPLDHPFIIHIIESWKSTNRVLIFIL